MPFRAPYPIQVGPHENPKEPGPRRPDIAQLAKLPKAAQRHLLHQVLRISLVPAAEPQGGPIQGIEVLGQHLLEHPTCA